MFSSFFHNVIYVPIYNALALFVSWVPFGDVGIAIILITVLVKVILFPLAVRASHTQLAMRALEPELRGLREQYKDNKQELALKTLALYRAHNVKPFASMLVVLVQLPVIFGLYWVIWVDSKTSTFDPALLYSWVSVPQVTSYVFLNLVPLGVGSVFLALLVALSQYTLSRMMMPKAPQKSGKQFMDDLATSMHLQMRYVFPIVIGVISYVATAAIALYFLTSNVFGILQELVARQRHRESHGN